MTGTTHADVHLECFQWTTEVPEVVSCLSSLLRRVLDFFRMMVYELFGNTMSTAHSNKGYLIPLHHDRRSSAMAGRCCRMYQPCGKCWSGRCTSRRGAATSWPEACWRTCSRRAPLSSPWTLAARPCPGMSTSTSPTTSPSGYEPFRLAASYTTYLCRCF